MKRFVFSRAAELDIQQLDDATIEKFGLSQAIANREALHSVLRRLAENPQIGHLREDLSPPGRPFLYWTILGRFMIVYEPVEDGIRVARVLDGARNLCAELETDPGDGGRSS